MASSLQLHRDGPVARLRMTRAEVHNAFDAGLIADLTTALDGLAFETRPLYSGNPWFLAPSVAYYRWRDRRPV